MNEKLWTGLTERFEFIETDGALPLSCLDATRVENVITFEKPDFLRIGPVIKLQFAVIAAISLINEDATAQISVQDLRVLLHVTSEQSSCRDQDVLSVAFLTHLVLKCLLKLFKLHIVALIFKKGDNFVQIDVFAHLLDEFLMPKIQKPSKVVFFFITDIKLRIGVFRLLNQTVHSILDWKHAFKSMLPQIHLVFVRLHPTALLITDLHDIAHDLIKFLNIVIFSIHVLKHRIKKCVNDIFA